MQLFRVCRGKSRKRQPGMAVRQSPPEELPERARPTFWPRHHGRASLRSGKNIGTGSFAGAMNLLGAKGN